MIERRTYGALKESTAGTLVSYTRIVAVLWLVGVIGAGCSMPQQAYQDVVTVEGMVTARGNEPFVRYVLETLGGNLYALRIPEDRRSDFQTPARLRVTGRLYVDDWDGRPFAHLDVSEYSRID